MTIEVFSKMIALVAAGLYEKEQNVSEQTSYPYSNQLSLGMNIFAAQAVQYHPNYEMVLKDMHESVFLEGYASQPVSFWFSGWNDEIIQRLQKSDLWNLESLAYFYNDGKFQTTDECTDLIESLDDDLLNGLEQKLVYQALIKLSQSEYVAIRKFLIEHPVISEAEFREMKFQYYDNSDVIDALEIAYEKIPKNTFRCPNCEWTMYIDGKQQFCSSRSCGEPKFTKDDLTYIPHGHLRLKRGVMRYICTPGKLELEIKSYAEEKLGLDTQLWPEKDQYDIGITFPNGCYWAIDAKTHKNPYSLRIAISNDRKLHQAKYDQAFYVIPNKLLDENAGYCDICNRGLFASSSTSISCIPYRELIKLLRQEAKR